MFVPDDVPVCEPLKLDAVIVPVNVVFCAASDVMAAIKAPEVFMVLTSNFEGTIPVDTAPLAYQASDPDWMKLLPS